MIVTTHNNSQRGYILHHNYCVKFPLFPRHHWLNVFPYIQFPRNVKFGEWGWVKLSLHIKNINTYKDADATCKCSESIPKKYPEYIAGSSTSKWWWSPSWSPLIMIGFSSTYLSKIVHYSTTSFMNSCKYVQWSHSSNKKDVR